MNIVVFHGSPKGDLSVTLTYIKYVFEVLSGHDVTYFPISERIHKYEREMDSFQEIMDSVRKADGLIIATPVYHVMVPSQLKRFIELIYERKAEDTFRQKYVCSITTSVHYFDNAANNYLHGICDDLDMNFTGCYCAGMKDFGKPKERQRLIQFCQSFFFAIQNKIVFPTRYPRIPENHFAYCPSFPENHYPIKDKKITIVLDCETKDCNAYKMAQQMASLLDCHDNIVNLRDINIKGGCTGCLQCSLDNDCMYQNADDFIEFYNKNIVEADIVIMAGTMKDRYLSSLWKTFFDRSFFKTHIPVFKDKQVAFLLSGNLSHNEGLRDMLSSYPDVEQGNLVDIVSDECSDSQKIDRLLESLALRIRHCTQAGYISPSTFAGVGGRKILRDEIWVELSYIFQKDHSYYKKQGLKNGFIDFPKNSIGSKIYAKFIMLLTLFPPIRRMLRKEIKSRMLESYIKILEKVKQKK